MLSYRGSALSGSDNQSQPTPLLYIYRANNLIVLSKHETLSQVEVCSLSYNTEIFGRIQLVRSPDIVSVWFQSHRCLLLELLACYQIGAACLHGSA